MFSLLLKGLISDFYFFSFIGRLDCLWFVGSGGGGWGSLEPVDEKHAFVTKPCDLCTARELHVTYAPAILNHGPYGDGE